MQKWIKNWKVHLNNDKQWPVEEKTHNKQQGNSQHQVPFDIANKYPLNSKTLFYYNLEQIIKK